jgi:leucyl aminopeptidase (aminopeptidase T)
MSLSSNIEKLIYECGQLKQTERVVVICDPKTKNIAIDIVNRIENNNNSHCNLLEENIKIHGQEPTNKTAKAMLDADLIFGITSFSMAHTLARKCATDRGARYLSLPDYTLDVINSHAFEADFFQINTLCEKVCKSLSNKKTITVESKSGTFITLNIDGRSWNNASGLLLSAGSLGSPPDSEINIAPIESDTNGIIIVDGSIPIPEIGLLKSKEILTVQSGIVSADNGVFSGLLNKIFGNNIKNRIIGEFGIGFNEHAKLCGRMLEDEGSFGTCHFGIGSNSTIGGLNYADMHIDFVIKNPVISADGNVVFNNRKWLI